jgi:hypothetical protein
MKNLINRTDTFQKIEFWAATTIYVFIVFFHVTDAISGEWLPRAEAGGPTIPMDYYFVCKLVRYTILYIAFLVLNFKVVPKLMVREGVATNLLLLLLVFTAVGVVFGITDTYLRYYLFTTPSSRQATYNLIFRNSFLYAAWLLLVFGFYSVIKYGGLYLLTRSDDLQAKYKFITPGGLAAFILWLISMLFLFINQAEKGIIAGWATIIPCGILFYWLSFHKLIPGSLPKKNPFRAYLLRAVLVLVVSVVPVALFAAVLVRDGDGALAIGSFNAAFQLFITLPVSWLIFRRHLKGNEEVYVLKKELGRSNASFDFLRSQINPHFLFNALNTIYGTALQENASRTSEGIEKLGDMMRFMLQENMQDKISLAREIDYLNNYIGLQKLRTDPNPAIRIDTQIEEQVLPVQLPPMLLIPFVENAFKHGISFREPSYIKVSLEVKDTQLLFDVSNSKHPQPDNDPEKNRSGIGLTNVKERLHLLYPSKHELIIRETAKDFFIHLTIRLS